MRFWKRLVEAINAGWRKRAPRPTEAERGLTALAAYLARGHGTWAATENGECCTCGHEWIPGEIIGCVTQAYERQWTSPVTFVVKRSPGTRLACSVCVEQQRVQGDLSVAWAVRAGLL